MGIDWQRLKEFIEFLQETMPSAEQIWVWVLDWIVFNPPNLVVVVEVLLAISFLREGRRTLKRGRTLEPVYRPKREDYATFGYVEDGKAPQLPPPMPVPGHSYWYCILESLIYIGLSVLMWYLAGKGGWF